MFDLTLSHLYLIDGLEQTDLPGLYAANPPKKAARGRGADQLILQITLNGNAPLSADGTRQLLSRLADHYFQTAGSVTAALRSVCDLLNQYLLNRNLRNTSTGRQSVGLLVAAAIHDEAVFLAHAGPVHSFYISAGSVQHWHDAQTGGRGLGLSKSLNLRFYQAAIQPGDRLLLSPDAPVVWTTNSLAGGAALSLEQIRRRLLNQAPPSFTAGLVQFQAASSPAPKINLVHSTAIAPAGEPAVGVEPAPSKTGRSAESPASNPIDAPAPRKVEPQAPRVPETNSPVTPPIGAVETYPVPATPPWDVEPEPESAVPTPKSTDGSTASLDEPAVDSQPAETVLAADETAPEATIPEVIVPTVERVERNESPARTPVDPEPVPARVVSAEVIATPAVRPTKEKTPRPPRPRPTAKPFFQFLSTFLHGLLGLRQRMGKSLGQLLPGTNNQPGALSPGTMVFIAVAVPLLVVVAAVFIYVDRGQETAYRENYQVAYDTATIAQTLTDPADIRMAWEQVLEYAELAESNRPDRPEARELRVQAQAKLDEINNVQRLPFQVAIPGQLSPTVQITQMIATPSDLYMLDGNSGRVLRAIPDGGSYEMDTSFTCMPGQMGDLIVGPLIDIAPIPRGSELIGSIVGIDASGTVLTCGLGTPAAAFTLVPPENNWGAIAGFTYEQGSLFVLDSLNNGIWVYNPGALREAPHAYFDVTNLGQAIDLTVNGNDLFILHRDGHMTLCTSAAIIGFNTRCSDPAPYNLTVDNNEQSYTNIAGAQFTHMTSTNMPDPSLYILDAQGNSIHHFSKRLNFQHQFKGPDYPFNPFPANQPATALAISPNRLIFLAFGHQIFYERLP